MIRVILESPFGRRVDGEPCTEEEMARNTRYVLRALEDSLRRGEAPFASHALYPLVLKDANKKERRMGMEAGFAWGAMAERVVVYEDFGVTPGMREGLARWKSLGMEIESRFIGENK